MLDAKFVTHGRRNNSGIILDNQLTDCTKYPILDVDLKRYINVTKTNTIIVSYKYNLTLENRNKSEITSEENPILPYVPRKWSY